MVPWVAILIPCSKSKQVQSTETTRVGHWPQEKEGRETIWQDRQTDLLAEDVPLPHPLPRVPGSSVPWDTPAPSQQTPSTEAALSGALFLTSVSQEWRKGIFNLPRQRKRVMDSTKISFMPTTQTCLPLYTCWGEGGEDKCDPCPLTIYHLVGQPIVTQDRINEK